MERISAVRVQPEVSTTGFRIGLSGSSFGLLDDSRGFDLLIFTMYTRRAVIRVKVMLVDIVDYRSWNEV